MERRGSITILIIYSIIGNLFNFLMIDSSIDFLVLILFYFFTPSLELVVLYANNYLYVIKMS